MTITNQRTPNYTLGKGRIYFSRFLNEVTQELGPFRYLGNSPELALTIESTDVEHFSSEAGVNELDAVVPLQITRSGSFSLDDISIDNLALFFFGSSAPVTEAAVVDLTEDFVAPMVGDVFQVGVSDTRRYGHRGLTAFSLSDGGVTTYVEGVDYSVDLVRGQFNILNTTTLDGVTDVTATYSVGATTQEAVISGSTPVSGAINFYEANPQGENRDFFLPYVRISPSGDLSLKGDDWRTMPFSLQVLKPAVGEAIYINGAPVPV